MAGTPEISQGSESVYQKKTFNIQHFEGNKMQSSYIRDIFKGTFCTRNFNHTNSDTQIERCVQYG